MPSDKPRERWRMSHAELCARCHVNAPTLDAWARAGVLGSRFTEARDHGWAHHITREAAERAMLASRLIRTGVSIPAVLQVVARHVTGARDDLRVRLDSGVELTVSRKELD